MPKQQTFMMLIRNCCFLMPTVTEILQLGLTQSNALCSQHGRRSEIAVVVEIRRGWSDFRICGFESLKIGLTSQIKVIFTFMRSESYLESVSHQLVLGR